MVSVIRIVAMLAAPAWLLGDVKSRSISRDAAGRLSVRSEMREGTAGDLVKNGAETTYFPDGTVASQSNYENDLLDGPWKKWSAPEHLPEAEGTYRHHGKKVGQFVRYLTNGAKLEQTEYKDGLREGRHVEWDYTGHQVLRVTLRTRSARWATAAMVSQRRAKILDELRPRIAGWRGAALGRNGQADPRSRGGGKGKRSDFYREWFPDGHAARWRPPIATDAWKANRDTGMPMA